MLAGRWIAGCSGLVSEWDREEIRQYQSRQLRALVRHAYERVPYYRRLFDQARLKPDQVRTLDDLARRPPTSRTDLQGLPEQDIVARGFDPEKLVVHRTSGSSGEPLSIRRTWFEDRLLQAYRLRVLFRLRYVSDRSAGRRGHRPADTEPHVHAVGCSPL
jgi:phenylacetate-coenzyme A ligase PaaK-like adenylate-forming protein